MVTAAGSSSATAQQAATAPCEICPAPRARARRTSQPHVQTAKSTSPGSTTGTSRRLAHGWSGTMPGFHKVVTTAQPMTRTGRPQIRAAPRRNLRASCAAPNVASSTAGSPMYQITQYRLSSA